MAEAPDFIPMHEGKNMKKEENRILGDERGMALVLAILLISLLASFGVWMIVESTSELKTSKSYERFEETVHLAEGATWLAVHTFDVVIPELPNNATSLVNMTPSLNATQTYLRASQPVGGNQTTGGNQTAGVNATTITPQIFSNQLFYNNASAATRGYAMNSPGGTPPYWRFYLCRGQGDIRLPAGKGSARSVVYGLASRLQR